MMYFLQKPFDSLDYIPSEFCGVKFIEINMLDLMKILSPQSMRICSSTGFK
jgi:hypothetical protein